LHPNLIPMDIAQYAMYDRQGRTQSQSFPVGQRKIPIPAKNDMTVVQPVASYLEVS